VDGRDEAPSETSGTDPAASCCGLLELIRTNPWRRLSFESPYVLPEDEKGAEPFQLQLMPCPWSGPVLTARVLLLLLNPGYEAGSDEEDMNKPEHVALCREQLSGLAPFPWLGSSWSAHGGARYWWPLLRRLRQDVGDEALAESFATVQLVGYASRTWVDPTGLIVSQSFTSDVVRHALGRGSLLVVARGWADWVALVGEPLRAADVIQLRSRRRPYLTPGNMGDDGYARVKADLLAGRPASSSV
jgi:hypothetical protein